jgi:hypothetical protein
VSRPTGDRAGGLAERVSRADLILGCMPVLFVGGYGVGAVAFDAWSAAIASASVVCLLPMADGLVRNPPCDG